MTDLQERKELENKIKQCDLKSFAILKGKSLTNEKFWVVYFQRCDLLRRYREKFGEKAHQQLREQLNNV